MLAPAASLLFFPPPPLSLPTTPLATSNSHLFFPFITTNSTRTSNPTLFFMCARKPGNPRLSSHLFFPLITTTTKESTRITRTINPRLFPTCARKPGKAADGYKENSGNAERKSSWLQASLWTAEGIYITWLFLLPYAPGDPVWAISSDTLNSLVGLSLNFFFILPLMNSVGIRLIDAPVLHPMAEGLFNFVLGWTFMFAPLLFTDCKRDRYKGSLDILWGFQMFLTNTFLIPYMAIRLNEGDEKDIPRQPSQLGAVMTDKAPYVGLVGGAICLISTLWALFGRSDGNFGGVMERWNFLVTYLGSERLAYAFIWDICLYIIFQPWLIGDNIQNIEKSKTDLVNYLRFVPVVGLVVYLLCLDVTE